MEFIIRKATPNDYDALEALYNTLNDHLQATVNYPGWLKTVYPVRQTAVDAIAEGTLFVLTADGATAGSIVLSHRPETAYNQAKWGLAADYSNIIVIHTLAVHPAFMRLGVAKKLMDFAKEYALQNGMAAIRLDVSEHNAPAIALYERCGYRYVATVDLGLGIPNLKWFRLYEMNL